MVMLIGRISSLGPSWVIYCEQCHVSYSQQMVDGGGACAQKIFNAVLCLNEEINWLFQVSLSTGHFKIETKACNLDYGS